MFLGLPNPALHILRVCLPVLLGLLLEFKLSTHRSDPNFTEEGSCTPVHTPGIHSDSLLSIADQGMESAVNFLSYRSEASWRRVVPAATFP